MPVICQVGHRHQSGADISAVNTESTRNIPRKFFAKTILGGNVMDLEPPAELEPGEPIKLYLITTPCDPVLSAGLDAQWFRHITLICGKKKSAQPGDF